MVAPKLTTDVFPMRLPLCFALMCLTACASFPDIDRTVPEVDANTPFPALVPLGPLLAQAETATTARITPASIAATNGRIAGLQARAGQLRGPVISPATRAEMRRGVDLAALR
ncbi:hypothetical protein [Yoonia sp. 208BN28-4]|uniref:hypothetical protein n=1 Tax=Yoonia sp. 208BN28-4 TaxID=3126505 RepID=UPI00309F24F2